MTLPSFSARTLSPAVVVLVGVVAAGCAHGAGSGGETATDAADERDPADRSTVTAEEIEQSPREPIEELLEGRIAGVAVMRTPDGGIAVRIRGDTSIRGNNEPLYVIDGMPVQPGPNGALTGLSIHDIRSIRVLKDAADTAMYGARGANGVIVIETKQPGD